MTDWRLIVLVLCLFVGAMLCLFGLLGLVRLERTQTLWRSLLSIFVFQRLDTIPDEFKAVRENWTRCLMARRLFLSGLAVTIVAGGTYMWLF